MSQAARGLVSPQGNQAISRSLGSQTIIQSISPSGSQAISQSRSQTVNQAAKRSISHSDNQAVYQIVKQPASQSVRLIHSDDGLTLETSVFESLTVATLWLIIYFRQSITRPFQQSRSRQTHSIKPLSMRHQLFHHQSIADPTTTQAINQRANQFTDHVVRLTTNKQVSGQVSNHTTLTDRRS